MHPGQRVRVVQELCPHIQDPTVSIRRSGVADGRVGTLVRICEEDSCYRYGVKLSHGSPDLEYVWVHSVMGYFRKDH